MRTRTFMAVAALASVSALAAAPAVPADEPLVGRVEVSTDHHEVPDGILTADVTITGDTAVPGACPYGDGVRIGCTDDGASGDVAAAMLGFSMAHRHGLATLDGTVRDVIQVEPSDAGDLTVTFEVPDEFDSTITAAPGANVVTDRSAVWRLWASAGQVVSFDILIAGPGADVSELGAVTVELERDGAPIVASSFGEVVSPEGSVTTRVQATADRDVLGTAPTFGPIERNVEMGIRDHAFGLVSSSEVASNGIYSGVAQGYVEGAFTDSAQERDLYRPYNVNSGITYGTFADTSRLKLRYEPFATYWGTSEQLPFDHHEVVTSAAMRFMVNRPDYDDFLDEGPQSVASSGGQIVTRQVGSTIWTTGLTSQSLAAQQNDPTERPSRAGEAVALMGIVYDATAVGGDIDNRDGSLGQVGDPVVLAAPNGWIFDDAIADWGQRVQFPGELAADGRTVTFTPTITDGTVFPMEWDGAPYVSTIAFILRLRTDELSMLGVPTPAPHPELSTMHTGHRLTLLRHDG